MPRPSPQTERVLDVITMLTEGDEAGATLTEVAQRLGVGAPTCVHLLAAMAERGFLVRDPVSRRYRLGPALLAPGQVAAARYPVLAPARAEIDALARTLGLPCFAFVRDGDHARLVHRAWDLRRPAPAMRLGDVLPVTPPLGSVFVAWAAGAEVDRWLARGRIEGDGAQRLRATLAAVRRLGFVVELHPPQPLLHELVRLLDRAQQTGRTARLRSAVVQHDYVASRLDPASSYAVSSISVPVFAPDGSVALACNVVGLPEALSGRAVRDLGHACRVAMDRVTAALGGTAAGPAPAATSRPRRPRTAG